MKALIINDNGHDFRVVPVFDRFSPNVLYWAKNTHRRLWRGSTRIAIISRCVVLLARIRNATLFFALKVQYNLAQGSALGYDTTRPMRPVGVAH